MNTTVQPFIAERDVDRTDKTVGVRVSELSDKALIFSTVIVLGWIGAMKFTAYEAGAIEGLVASSPLVSWLYSILSLQGASNLIGTVEIVTAVTLMIGMRNKTAAILGAFSSVVIFTVTLSFLFTAPGWEASLGGFPALSVVPGQFLLKDVVLLAVAFSLLGKALNR